MRSVGSPLLFLALCGGITGPLWGASPALAAEASESVFEAPLLAALPVGDLLPGATHEVPVLALDVDGAALTGLGLTATVDVGTVGAVREVGDGLYVVAVTAPADGDAVALTLRGKAQKVALEATRSLPVAAGAAPSAQSNPERLVLGRDSAATLTLTDGGAAGVRVRTSAGTVGKRLRRGERYTAQLTPPTVNFPQVTLVTWADAAEPFARQAWQAVPLSGAVAFPVEGPAGASVLLQVAGREFGPVELDADGKGKVSIEVPPGVQEATQITVVGGDTTESTLDLDIPPTQRIAWFPLPETLPADAALSVPLRLVVVTPEGAADAEAAPTFAVDKGQVGAVRSLGGGRYEATWSLPDTVGVAKATARLPGSEVDEAVMEVELVDGLGVPLTLVADPAPPAAPSEVRLTGDADADVIVTGAAAGERRVDGTTVVVPLTEVDASALEVRAAPVVALAQGPVQRALLLPSRPRVSPDGTVGVLVATVDAMGLPVPGVEVGLSVEGPGTVPASVTTGDDGTAWVRVGASEAGLVSLRSTVPEGRAHGAAIVVAPDGVAVPALTSGDPIAARWAATHPSLGAAPAQAARPVATPVRRFLMVETLGEVDGEPPLEVRVTVVDASGQSVDGLVPEVELSAGTVGEPVADAGTGTVTFPISLPEGHRGGVEITVREPAGAEETVTVGGEVIPYSAPAPAPARDVILPGDDPDPWVRARVSGVASSYRYAQTPAADPGGLLPVTLAVGRDGGTAASPAGFELDGRLWLDAVGVPWLGFHASTRATFYAIEADIFDAPARDQLIDTEIDLLGRVPLELGGDTVWFGARAGFRYDDFVVFEGCLEPGCTFGYSAVGLAGLGLGPEVGAELGRLFFVGGYNLGLARGTQPFSHTVDLEVGVEIVAPLYVDVGFSSITRRVELRGADTDLLRGEVDDAQMLGRFGVGVAF